MKTKMSNRVISAILAIMMVFTMMPLNAFAMAGGNAKAGTDPTSPVEGETGSEGGVTVTTDPEGNTLTYVKWDGITVASSLSGEGTEESPYLISDGAELMYFAQQVNGGNSYEGEYILLEENIDMDMFNNGKTWTPIGVYS